MHNMHVQRFQDSNERTDKNPWLGLWRVSVKRGVGVYLFLKNVVLGLGLGLTLTLTLTRTLNLTLTLNNSNLTITLTLKQHSLKKKKKRWTPTPAPRFTDTRLRRELWKRLSPIPMAMFLPKSALFCDKISDVMIFPGYSADRSFNRSREKWILLRWDIFMLCDAIFRFPFHLRGGSSARWQQELLKDVEDDRTSPLLLGSHQSCSYNGFET